MKKYKGIVSLIVAFCSAGLWFASGFCGEAEEKKGFQLSEKAQKSLGLAFAKLEGVAPWKIPAESLVAFQDHVGVYRLRDGRFKLVHVEIADTFPSVLTVRCPDLQAADQIVVQGAAHLRITDLGNSEEFQEEHVD